MKIYLRKQAEKKENKDIYLLNDKILNSPCDEECLEKIIYHKSHSFRVYKNVRPEINYFISFQGLIIEFFPKEHNSKEETTVIFYLDKIILTNYSWEIIIDSFKTARIQNGEVYIKKLREDYKLIIIRLLITLTILLTLIIITLWILIKM